jgi:hypothetical protein
MRCSDLKKATISYYGKKNPEIVEARIGNGDLRRFVVKDFVDENSLTDSIVSWLDSNGVEQLINDIKLVPIKCLLVD